MNVSTNTNGALDQQQELNWTSKQVNEGLKGLLQRFSLLIFSYLPKAISSQLIDIVLYLHKVSLNIYTRPLHTVYL